MKNKKVKLFVIALIATFIIQHIILYLSPNSNLNIAQYNIHHIFLGAFFLVILVILMLFNHINSATIILAGVFSSFILDELIFLIATNGLDTLYWSKTSFIGSLIMHAIILIFISILYYKDKK